MGLWGVPRAASVYFSTTSGEHFLRLFSVLGGTIRRTTSSVGRFSSSEGECISVPVVRRMCLVPTPPLLESTTKQVSHALSVSCFSSSDLVVGKVVLPSMSGFTDASACFLVVFDAFLSGFWGFQTATTQTFPLELLGRPCGTIERTGPPGLQDNNRCRPSYTPPFPTFHNSRRFPAGRVTGGRYQGQGPGHPHYTPTLPGHGFRRATP